MNPGPFKKLISKLIQKEHDFLFVIGFEGFKVHKSVLSLSSVVLDKMLTIDMIEKKRSVCVVTNFDANIFENMLYFLYNRELKDGGIETYLKIYEIADYYQIEDLIEYVRWKIYMTLRNELTWQNAMKNYEIAINYKIQNLIDDCWFLIKQ